MKIMMSYYKQRAMDSFCGPTSKNIIRSLRTSSKQRTGNYKTNANASSFESLTAAWKMYHELKWLLSATSFLVSGYAIYHNNIEIVPFTKRNRFILDSPGMEKKLGERMLERESKNFQHRILPAQHPLSVRVRLMLEKITEAMPEEVKRCKHLHGLNWEILLVNDRSRADGVCFPGGKVVVFTGCLQVFTTETELATIIGHLVAQGVARQMMEEINKKIEFFIKKVWFAIARFVLLDDVFMPDLDLDTMSKLVLEYPFLRLSMTEVDYIGLLLIASAGYDPQIAYKAYEKFGQDSLPTLPSGIERSQLLAQTHVMEEALVIYNEVRAREWSQEQYSSFE